MPNTNPSTQVASADQNDDLRTLRKQTQDGTMLVPAAGLKFVTDLGDPANTTVASVSATGGITPGSGGLVSDSLTTNTATSETITSTVADGATAVAVILKSSHTLANGSAKLLSIKNNATEKASIGADGTARFFSMASGTGGSITTANNVNISDNAILTGAPLLGIASQPLVVKGAMTDGASAVAVQLDTSVAYANAGAKLVSFQNNGVEKAFILSDGTAEFNSIATTTGLGILYTNHIQPQSSTTIQIDPGNTLSMAGPVKLISFTDTSGTPGSGVANTTCGRSAFATTSTATITITNSLCATGDIVLCQLETNDATCLSMRAVCGNGSFTATPGAVTGGTTKFSWVVIKTA